VVFNGQGGQGRLRLLVTRDARGRAVARLLVAPSFLVAVLLFCFLVLFVADDLN
jgi:hypothetical protein